MLFSEIKHKRTLSVVLKEYIDISGFKNDDELRHYILKKAKRNWARKNRANHKIDI